MRPTRGFRLYRAQDIGDQKVPDVTIHIADAIERDQSLDGLHSQFRADAATLFEALRSLPGGTLDQLLVLLLQHKASHFVVPG